MDNKLIYPKTIEDLMSKITYIMENDENEEKMLNLYNFIEWYNDLNYDFKYLCEENEFLKPYYNNGKYALQVWVHNTDVDVLKFNLISNFYSEYNDDITLIKEDSE